MGGGRSKPRREGVRPYPETFCQLFNGSREWFRAQPLLPLQDTMILTAHEAVTLRPLYDDKPQRVCKPTKDSSANMTAPMNVNLLCAACWCGDFELVKLFMAKGVPVECPDKEGAPGCCALHCIIMTPRPVACRYEIADYLLSNSKTAKDWINMRVASFNDCTALECAMQQGNTPLAGLLISRGASLLSSHGKNVLAMVASTGIKGLLLDVLTNMQVTDTQEFRQSCEAAAFAFADKQQLRTYLNFLAQRGLFLFDENFSWPLQAFSQPGAVEQFVAMGAKEPDAYEIRQAARTLAAAKKHTGSMLPMEAIVSSLRGRLATEIRKGLAELCGNILQLLFIHLSDPKVASLVLGYSHNFVEPVPEDKKDEKEEKVQQKEEKTPFVLLDFDPSVKSEYEKELMEKAAALEIDADVDCPEEDDVFVETTEHVEQGWVNFAIVDDPLVRPLPAYVDVDLRQSLLQNMREPPPRVEPVVVEEVQPVEEDSDLEDDEEKHASPSSSTSATSTSTTSTSSISSSSSSSLTTSTSASASASSSSLTASTSSSSSTGASSSSSSSASSTSFALEDDLPQVKPAFLHQPSYVLMDNSELASMQHNLVQELVDVMGLTDSEVAKLLSHYNGNKQVILSKWFSDSEQVRAVVGLAAETKRRLTLETRLREQDVLSCQLCDDSVPYDQTYALACQHRYCLDCWKGWMNAAFDKGPAAAFTCCMSNQCRLVLPREFWNRILDTDQIEKFENWCTSLFVKNNVFVKYCPAAKCGRAVSYQQGGTKTIKCECGLVFCFSCLEEDHRPCSCALVAKWREKNQSEGENVNWILAHCKICPKCKSPIEKNQGCDHMTCRREAGGCGHEFCWLCKKDWRGHSNCAQYEGDAQDESKKAADAATILEMYTHHFTRWSSHLESSKFAVAQQTAINTKIASMRIADPLLTENSIQFLSAAVETVRACRRILAWSHALAYFLPKDSYKELFETHQSQLGAFTEQLNAFTEGKVEDLIDRKFREKTMNLNRVTQKFRDNVLDFCDINYTHWASVETKSAKCEVKCKNGHPVVKFLTERRTYNCDICTTAHTRDAVMWGCRACDYDYCKDCHSKARKKLKLESLAAEQAAGISKLEQLTPALQMPPSSESSTPSPSLTTPA